MAGFRVIMHVRGLDELLKKLDKVSDYNVRRLMPAVLRAMCKPVAGAAKLRARFSRHPSTGALAESIGIKTTVRSRARSLGIVGARKGFERQVDGEKHDPVKIAHLVEYGHAGPGGSGARTPPRPFLRPAFDERAPEAESRGQEALNRALRKLGLL